jgi:hypothetical protein
MVATEDLNLVGSQVWQNSDHCRYLYEPCVSLELPSLGIKKGLDIKDDWQAHMHSGLLACNQQAFEELAFKTPLRCLILSMALEKFFSEKTEDELASLLHAGRLAFLQDLVDYVLKHISNRAVDKIVATSQIARSDSIPRESLRLLLHLVPPEIITESFYGVTSVDLSGELFCDKILPRLSAFQNMAELKLAFSDVQEQDLVALTALTDLKILDLSGTRIGNFGLEILVNCPTLKVLRLTNCLIDSGAVEIIRQMKDRLESITLSRQSMGESASQALEQMIPKIVWLGKPDSSLQPE